MDWHPATVSLRKDTYYVVLTVPKAARPAMGDKTQIRMSTGTTDKAIAVQRKFELEGKLRDQVLAAVRRASLNDAASSYQQAVKRLRLVDHPYDYAYDEEIGDVLLRRMSDAPSRIDHIDPVTREFNKVLLRLKGAAPKAEDHVPDISLLEDFDLNPPSVDEADALIKAAVLQLHKSFATPEAVPTVSTLLDTYQRTLEQRVARKDLKSKTAKARLKNIKQFIDVIGDHPLDEVDATHAYSFAEMLGKDYSNSTVKTRVSDVSTLFEDAVRAGKMKQNPFINLKLRNYGKRGRNYTPLSDDLLMHLFAIPKLRLDVKRIWAILVCTGMRLDEVATLRLHQIQETDSTLHFDLTNAVVKNVSAQRRVPICEVLVPLIRQMVEERTGREHLFDFGINVDGKTRASSLCGYWMNKANLSKVSRDATARFTNHSLRGTFKDKMRDAEVAQEVHNAILGHDQHTVGAAYGRGPSLNIMKSAVDKANHPYLDWIASED